MRVGEYGEDGIHTEGRLLMLNPMTDGMSVPFESGAKTARLVEAATWSRGSKADRLKFDRLMEECSDKEMQEVFTAYMSERMKYDDDDC